MGGFPWTDYLHTESASVEWKESDRDWNKILEAVCAMANDLPGQGQAGVIVLGVRNDGVPVGLPYATAQERDAARLKIADNLNSTKLLPHPSYRIEETELLHDGKPRYLMALVVEPCAVPPVVKANGRAYVRSTAQTRAANDADYARLMERRPNVPFDLRPCAEVGLSELPLALLREDWAERKARDAEEFPSFERWLQLKDLARLKNNVYCPTYACLLLYASSPDTYLPGAYIDLAMYPSSGYEESPTLRKIIKGPLGDQIRMALFILSTINLDSPVSDGITEKYLPMYPEEAFQELVSNMVQHRAYDATRAPSRIECFSDRIVFSNPGGPYGLASSAPFGDHSDYRNPTVTAGLVEQGYIQKLGRGVRRANAHLSKNGNPPLEVKINGFTSLTLKKRP